MKDTLETINQMQRDGIIGKYAIGGAVGATFYLEPAATLDVYIFVMIPGASSGGPLLSLTPIYHYLTARGCHIEAEYIVIATGLCNSCRHAPNRERSTTARSEVAPIDAGPSYFPTTHYSLTATHCFTEFPRSSSPDTSSLRR